MRTGAAPAKLGANAAHVEGDVMVLAAVDYPLLDLFWTTLIVFGWVLWFWLLFRVYGDLFRRQDIGGGTKTGWVVLTLLLPFIGSFAYLITQGRGMAERVQRDAEQQRAASDAYIRSVVAESDGAQLAKARGLLESGAITTDEFDRLVAQGH
jgi:hypothetical protein